MPTDIIYEAAKRLSRRRLMSLAIVASCAVSIVAGSATPSFAKESRSLSQLWREVSRQGRYIAPSRAELQQAEWELRFGVTIAFTWRGAAIAAAVMAFPLMVRAMRLSFEAADQRLETAARTLGAGPVRVFVTVTLPQIAPGILTGVVLAFARSLGVRQIVSP